MCICMYIDIHMNIGTPAYIHIHTYICIRIHYVYTRAHVGFLKTKDLPTGKRASRLPTEEPALRLSRAGAPPPQSPSPGADAVLWGTRKPLIEEGS